MEYPQPTSLCPDERTVKSAQLVGYLNNKASIGTLVDPRFQARRSSSPPTSSPEATPAGKSWVLKAATDDAHGASLDVYLHRAGEQVEPAGVHRRARRVRGRGVPGHHRNWGIQLYVAADGRARLLAVTEQRIDADGVYSGGRFGLDRPAARRSCSPSAWRSPSAPPTSATGACAASTAPRPADGSLVMLDLNFRITSGSIPLLALESIRPDDLDRPAESMKLAKPAPLARLLADLEPALAAALCS